MGKLSRCWPLLHHTPHAKSLAPAFISATSAVLRPCPGMLAPAVHVAAEQPQLCTQRMAAAASITLGRYNRWHTMSTEPMGGAYEVGALLSTTPSNSCWNLRVNRAGGDTGLSAESSRHWRKR